MLVLPHNWNIQYLKKIFISNVALTELIMKSYLPTPISLHVIRHMTLGHSLSALFDLLPDPESRP